MDSRRSERSDLQTPLRPILSGKAAFSSKNGLSFLKQYSDAGFVAGVFFGGRRALARRNRQ
ncbi:MAG TPA: hypothetical protein VF797_03335 [Noviherbaspirillum sp.]|jgi:hypothetical protein|uniref:hypothetical protein n=1 Tax=Noviherbaspirillum sp. L7-7A TaxID=2850560 RepID=UPI001C2BB5CE|nr:hypothetical protein [Noviherbaspirillum sp. L7-7A]MBV0879994.1 hypothetical protein [Noviherbaspirillum sp. L7-7A]